VFGSLRSVGGRCDEGCQQRDRAENGEKPIYSAGGAGGRAKHPRDLNATEVRLQVVVNMGAGPRQSIEDT